MPTTTPRCFSKVTRLLARERIALPPTIDVTFFPGFKKAGCHGSPVPYTPVSGERPLSRQALSDDVSAVGFSSVSGFAFVRCLKLLNIFSSSLFVRTRSGTSLPTPHVFFANGHQRD